MLLPLDVQAVQNSGLRPNAQSSQYAPLAIRAATVATVQYNTYTPGTYSIAEFVFGQNVVMAGSQVRFSMFGTATNATGSPQAFVPAIRITQASTNTAIIATWTIDSYMNTSAWEIDGVVTFSAANTTVPPTAKTTVPTVSTASYGSPLRAVGGKLRLVMSDAGLTGGNVAGGAIVATTPGAFVSTVESFLITTVDPNATLLVDATQPIGVSMVAASDVDFTVQGGWIEAM